MSKGSFSDRIKKKSQNLANEGESKKDLDYLEPEEEAKDFKEFDETEEESSEGESGSSSDSGSNPEQRSLPEEEKDSKKVANKEPTESDQKSFADRFAKKPAFSSQKAEDKKPQKKNDLTDIANVDPKKRAQADLIYLVKGIDDGRNAWYYVLVDRPKVQLFLKALNDDIIHLENYGVILYSAYGDDPPQEITDAINKEYGIK